MNIPRVFHSRIFLFLGFGLPFTLLVFWDTFLAWAMVVRFQMNDFGKFYYSTLAFLNNQEMYGPNPSTLGQIGTTFAQQFWNLNPPHFHLFLLPLGTLSPNLALTIWGITSFAAFFVGMHWIGNELQVDPTVWQRRLVALGILAFAGTGGLLLTGQLSLFLFLLLTLGWIHARHGKWERAALSIGLASTIKPFLLIFLPYFVLRGQLKAAGIILAFNISGFVVGLIVFGYTSYESWLQCLTNMDWTWPFMNASILGIVTRTFTENPMYGVITNAENLSTFLWFTSSIILGVITLYITTNDTSPSSIDRGFALLLITALLISPLGWIYYFFLPIGPMTGVVTTWWKNGNKKIFFQPRTLLGARNSLFLLMGAGFLIPPEATLLFQPNAFATLTLGSTYFWSAVALVCCLLLDWKLDNPHKLLKIRVTGIASY